MSSDGGILARLIRRPSEDPMPHLTDHGVRVEPTRGDVDAIFAACVRLFVGETVVSTTRSGAPLTIVIDPTGDAVLSVNGAPLVRCSAHDACVHAYGLISNFNIAWEDFEGRIA